MQSPETEPGMPELYSGCSAACCDRYWPGKRNIDSMSRELQDKADRIMRELRESLVPIKEEISRMRKNQEEKNTRTLK